MKQLPIAICVLLLAFPMLAQPQWGNLTPGPYKVGYQVFSHYDRGRAFKAKVDFEGAVTSGENAVPVQLSMWYPAEPSSGDSPFLFEEYLFLTKQRNDFRQLSEQEKEDAANGLKFIASYGAGIELSHAELLQIRKSPVAAYMNAKPFDGRFPLIIAGHDGGPSSVNILFEFLASHGFVVMSTPSAGPIGTLQATNPQLALNSRIGNMEYLLARSYDFGFIDQQKIGVVGINFDGMTALLFQMKNMQADAVVSIDGWEGKAGSAATLKNSVYYDPLKMRVPYFTVLQDEKNPSAYLTLSTEIFDSLLYSSRFYCELTGMNHAFLTGNLGVLTDLGESKRKAYQVFYEQVLGFLNASLKGGGSMNGLPGQLAGPAEKELVKTDIRKKAFPAVPTPAELEPIVMEGDIDKVCRIFQEARKHNPGVEFFTEQTLNLYAFRFSQRKDIATVLAIRQLAAEAFPESPYAYNHLSAAYEQVGDKTAALANALIALEKLQLSSSIGLEEKEKLQISVGERIKRLR